MQRDDKEVDGRWIIGLLSQLNRHWLEVEERSLALGKRIECKLTKG